MKFGNTEKLQQFLQIYNTKQEYVQNEKFGNTEKLQQFPANL